MINKFLKENKKIIKKNFSKSSIALVDRERPYPAILSSIILAAFANKKKMRSIIITNMFYENINKIYKSFGFENFFIVSNLSIYFKNIYTLILSIYFTIYGVLQVKFFGFNKFINNFYVSKILIGDLIYDSYIKNDKNFINPKINLKLLRLIFLSCFKTLRIDTLFKKNNIKFIFVLTDCYATNEAISIRLGILKNIKVFKINYSSERIFMIEAKKFEQKEGFLPIYKYFSYKKFKSSIEINNNKIEKFLNKRFLGKINFSYCSARDLISANKNKKNFSRNNFFKKINRDKNSINKIVLFAPHAFSDAPHHFGTNFVFNDYYDQFIQTIDFFDKEKSLKNVLLLVRPHPSSKIYKEENIVKNYISKCINKNIIYCSSNFIGTKNLIQICDNVITGRGTIGLEFACYGKIPITAGASTYSKFNFSSESRSKEEYFNKLRCLENIKSLKKEQIKLAKKLLFYVELNYPKKMSKKMDMLLFTEKKNSIISLLKNNNKKIWTRDFFKNLSLKRFDEDNLYKFYFKNAKFL